MAFDPRRAAGGALAGAVAAGVWTIQQPLDQRIFGVRYDDTELLGKLVTRGPRWRSAGLTLHLVNGALFGAAYAQVAPGMRLPAWARGPAAALGECLGTWPLAGLSDRLHPARDELPTLWGNGAALAQAIWRHLLFGTVLGELERRLNPPLPEEPVEHEHTVSTNGHGNIEHAFLSTGG